MDLATVSDVSFRLKSARPLNQVVGALIERTGQMNESLIHHALYNKQTNKLRPLSRGYNLYNSL